MTYRLKIFKGAVILGISLLGPPQYVIPDPGLCRLLGGLPPVYKMGDPGVGLLDPQLYHPSKTESKKDLG